jgi:hypothetical protein
LHSPVHRSDAWQSKQVMRPMGASGGIMGDAPIQQRPRC